MGATVTTNKSVGTFECNGKHYFVAFEETYEKNVYPHTPHWGCTAFGTYEQVLQKIFQYGAACEGGGLQVRGGNTTPEAYIRSWLKQLNNPVTYNADQTFQLRKGGSIYATIPTEHFEDVVQILNKINREDLADRLTKDEEVPINLVEQIDVVNALYGVGGVLAPWRVFKKQSLYSLRLAHFNANVIPQSSEYEGVKRQFMRIGGNNILVKVGDGKWQNGGWEYNVISEFIRSLTTTEVMQTGVLKAVTQMRATIKNATKVPADTEIDIVFSADGVDEYYIGLAKKIAKSLSIETPFAVGCRICVEHCDASLIEQILRLKNQQLEWIVPDAGNKVQNEADQVQGSLELCCA